MSIQNDKEDAMEMPERLDLASMDIAADRLEELLRVFPEVATEGRKVDFDQLKRALGETIDPRKERYGMNWPGKADCFKAIQTPSMGTLLPVPEESVDFDATENLIIEGDNLEVLKLLQKSYLGKIKMIYIDPPYNTGNDFIYPDDYSESLQTYLEYTGQVDSEGKKFSTNTDTDGRFHSKWLSMMYPRLYLARTLLREDGVIFVSIDDGELSNLRRLCDEVFGEENRLAIIANVNNPKGRSDDKYFATAHDYLIVYGRSESTNISGFPIDETILRRYNKRDSSGAPYREIDLRKTGDDDRRVDRPDMFYWFMHNAATGEFYPTLDPTPPAGFMSIVPLRDDGVEGRWRVGIETALERQDRLIPKFMPNRKIWSVFELDYLSFERRVKPTTAWTFKDVNSERGSEQLIELGFQKELFARPKPVGLMKRLLQIGAGDDDIVLDFFAGSGTMAQAVLELGKEDECKRRFILVQLPEPTGRADFGTITEITKERARRVIQRQNEGDASKLELETGKAGHDRGFKVFKLAESNFRPWNVERPEDDKKLSEQLSIHVEHIRLGRSGDDLLYEILLKSGFPLTTKVEEIEFAGKRAFSVGAGALFICLEREVTLELMREMASKSPERVVCLDEGFAGNDQLKANAVQIFKTKGITSFKTI